MRVLTKDDVAESLHVDSLDAWIHELSQSLTPPGAAYTIPQESKAQIALAKFLAFLLLEHSGVYLYLTRWSVRPNREHPELFYAYRRAMGEDRSLSEAPLHFVGQKSQDELVSLLCLALFFGWDAWLFAEDGATLVRITHESGLQVQTDGRAVLSDFAADPKKYFAPLAA